MKHRHTFLLRLSALSLIVLILSEPTVTKSRSLELSDSVAANSGDQKGRFICAFDWSVDGGRDYVWPFESMKPAPYRDVWMVVETVPRVWSQKHPGKGSISLSAYRALRVNGLNLPRPQRGNRSQEEFRIPLVNGRLRLSFTVPPGFKLDPKYAIVRVRLHEVG